MRILVCSQRDLPSCIALNDLIRGLDGHTTRVLLMSSDTTSGDEQFQWLQLIQRDIAIDLLFPILDRGPTKNSLLTFAGLHERFGAEFADIVRINDGDGLHAVREFKPDLILTLRFGLILRPHVFGVPSFGAFNVHPGSLPRFAGMFSPFYALLAGEKELGCTLHIIDQGIDSGPVVSEAIMGIHPDRSMFWHSVMLYRLGVTLFLSALGRIESGAPIVAKPQDLSRREYRSMPTGAEIAAFRAKGLHLVAPSDLFEVIGKFE